MNELFISDDAKDDLRESAEYYERKQTKLGHDFLDKVEEALKRIEENPKQFAVIYKEVRRALVGRFPHQILFIIKSFKIIVFSVFHTSRNPEIWKERADDEMINKDKT